MHWIDRGAEPASLSAIRSRFTPGWCKFCAKKRKRPSDSRWREFRDQLGVCSNWLCAYCERSTGGEVDHFRPVTQFPNLVYAWSNWVFACRDCNQAKLSKWYCYGYVVPCALRIDQRPENFFDFDLKTGLIRAVPGLSGRKRDRALRMIDDLKLNALHHIKARQNAAELALLATDPRCGPTTSKEIRKLLRPSRPNISVMRAAVLSRGIKNPIGW